MGGQKIEYQANGGKAVGYLAKPEGTANGKGIIVLQEWWGLVPHIEDIARRFAAVGYVALAPDLWDGKVAQTPDEAGRMLMALNIDDAKTKILGAATALHANGAAGKLGIVGFCMGGQVAVYTAASAPDEIGACVDFYGIHPKVKPPWATLEAPVLFIFGEKDESVPPAKGKELVAEIQAAGKKAKILVYPSSHAFMNDTRPQVYDETSAKDAWAKTLAFFAANL